MIEDDVVGRVARLADLLQHDLAFALEFALLEGRMGEDVGENIDAERHIGFQHARVERGLLAAGIGVEIAADRFDLLGDGARASGARCP